MLVILIPTYCHLLSLKMSFTAAPWHQVDGMSDDIYLYVFHLQSSPVQLSLLFSSLCVPGSYFLQRTLVELLSCTFNLHFADDC